MLALALAVTVALYLGACATDTGNPSKDRAGRVTNAVLTNLAKDVGKLAVGALASAVTTAASGDTNARDLEHSAATGVWKNVGTVDVASDVSNIVSAWNGGTAPAVATAAAQVFTAADPQTPAQKAAVMNVIAGTISGAAIAAP